MIVTANQVYGVSARCRDGFRANVEDVLFDDRPWNVRHLVICCGRWFNRRRVLVTPEDRNAKRVLVEPRWVDSIVWEDRGVHIHLPKAEIEHGREYTPEDAAAAL
jgi:hypothetical protein